MNPLKSKTLKVSALALGAAVIALTGLQSTPAQAGKKHIHIHFGYPGYVGYGYVYGYHHSCWWLKKKAIHTGSPYWWHKYHQCKFG